MSPSYTALTGRNLYWMNKFHLKRISFVLRCIDRRQFSFNCLTMNCNNNDDDKVLLAPYNYICRIPGKQIRTQLAEAFNHWLCIPSEKLHLICDIVQMLHNASLMIDDIEDSSILRRGMPVAHSIYGVPSTINSANYVYFMALSRVSELNHPEAYSIFTEQMLELHRGQGFDIYWRDSNICPSEDEYFKMIRRKTGGLFYLAIRLMQLFSKNKDDFRPLVDGLGCYFQVRDDLANLFSKDYAEQKTFAEDLTEGKYSFPVIHAINSFRDDDRILNIIRQKPKEIEVKRYCVQLLEDFGSFEYTKTKLIELEEKILSLIDEKGGNQYMKRLIEKLKLVYTN